MHDAFLGDYLRLFVELVCVERFIFVKLNFARLAVQAVQPESRLVFVQRLDACDSITGQVFQVMRVSMQKQRHEAAGCAATHNKTRRATCEAASFYIKRIFVRRRKSSPVQRVQTRIRVNNISSCATHICTGRQPQH